MAQPIELLELVEQHPRVAGRHDLERAWVAGLGIDDLEHAPERAAADRLADPEPAPDLAVSRFHRSTRLSTCLAGVSTALTNRDRRRDLRGASRGYVIVAPRAGRRTERPSSR